MSTTQAPVPTIRNAATRPPVRHKLFLNIPVSDLQRSITFFEALGFSFSTQFTDASATCMLVGEDAYVMLLTHERFLGFSHAPLGDPQRGTHALYTVSVDSREAVDEMVRKAVAAGGSQVSEPEDHGFMYDWSFRDPDGHGWGVFWMDPAMVKE